jgi:hypothetical protein
MIPLHQKIDRSAADCSQQQQRQTLSEENEGKIFTAKTESNKILLSRQDYRLSR